ncbi:MAG: hypothetical protein FD181_422 [Prolixibacteraceae bacterium]|nr:MAG: hypothetical protein FD181_422 [Prolixibacteraceae bacterium]
MGDILNSDAVLHNKNSKSDFRKTTGNFFKNFGQNEGLYFSSVSNNPR